MTVLPILLAVLMSTPTTEICSENPFKRWLASDEVTCSAPPSLQLESAAKLVPLLPPGTRAMVYAPRRAVAYPGPEVPAAEPLWLFVLQQSKPIAVFPIDPIPVGTERSIDARGAAPPAVIGWVEVPEADRKALENARGATTPSVVARVAGTTRDADPLPPLSALHGAFVRFANVPAGEGELVLQGRGWMTDRARVRVEPALTLIAQPLTARASASLIVSWSTEDDLAALERALGGCRRDEEPAKGQITISACTGPERPGAMPDPDSCTTIRQEPFDPSTKLGTFTFDDIPPGTYRAELKYGKLPPTLMGVPVAPLQQARLSLWVRYEKVYGSVTRGGEPLGEDAMIALPGGYGFARAESSEYEGVIRGPIFADAPITVAACDGVPRVIVLNDTLRRPNARLDIDIPANELVITVSDTFTREALVGSTIRMDVLSSRGAPTAASRNLKSGEVDDDESRVVARAIPPDRQIVLHVSHPGYHKQTRDPFSMTKSETKEVHVQLVPLRGTRGKIASQRPFVDAVVMWFSPDGSEIERADVAPDGTFAYERKHVANEVMAVVSSSHPLWVARSPSMNVQFPDAAPVRAVDVLLTGGDPRTQRHIGVVIGGIRVPQPALRQHQTQRRLPPLLRGRGPLPLRDLAETGPIDVILGPDSSEVAPRLSNMDLFAVPPFHELPRVRVTGATIDLGAR